MKTIKYILLVILSGCFFACDNPEDFQDVVYFTGTDVSPVVKYSLEEPTKIGLSVRASTKVDAIVKVGVKVNTDLIDKYNEANGTNYKPLPADSYSFDVNTAVIEQNQYASQPFYLDVKSIDSFKDEDIYCLPVEITNVQEGGLPVLESSRVMYLIINKTIITNATVLSGTYFKVNFGSDAGRDLSNVSQITMEARIFVDRFQTSDPYISSIMGLEEHFLLRFGDVKIDPNTLQLAGGGYPVSSSTNVSAGKWVHIAATYDGSRARLYIDGKLNAYTDAPRGGINLNGIDASRSFYIGRTSVDYTRYLYGKISEARVWTRVLSEAEIANGICAVSPDSPDLLAYWKFNSYKDDSNKNIVVDLTGHGYDAVGNTAVSFVEGVRCP